MAMLANVGWAVEVEVLHGQGCVQHFLVGADSHAEAEDAVRKVPGVYPQDRITVCGQLSPELIEDAALAPYSVVIQKH
ncbi:hypothetical protein [Bradyrhizobium elkanii]|uniref:hypothetical protein n=1 Tax=Bradyrhizobium elkanii TaxID=29448 RepID=UPI001AE5C7CA|nr:hypothetical protein [Bradyrhizobium elkanii]MBP2434176.1 hypothetical protein [Bradyrhizobium elkanii]WLA88912.1 hypothetical protein QNJ96_27890 [Bradyrhizobium elkanii]